MKKICLLLFINCLVYFSIAFNCSASSKFIRSAKDNKSAPVQPESKFHYQETIDYSQVYQHEETKQVVNLVKAAEELIRTKGEGAFKEFRIAGSKWRQGETYIFVFDTEGNALVHPDPKLEGSNQLDLKSINGKPIVRGFLKEVTSQPEKTEGWYHYQWPIPGGLTPRWKSSYIRLVKAPSGKNYIVGSGMYNDRMEKDFVIDLVKNAVTEIEMNGEKAYDKFLDPKEQFLVKDAYIIVVDMNGVELLNPAFPSFKGKNVLDFKDQQGKFLIKEMLRVAKENGSGWVDYMWPRPGESVPTRKSTYVRKAKMGDKWVVVGCGIYLDDAKKAISAIKKKTAPALVVLVREAAKMLEERGEKAFLEFRKKGSKWFNDDTYFFVWSMDGVRTFHAANPELEGKNVKDHKDVMGRPIGKMFLDVGATTKGEEWVHYMWPEPGEIFPTWKSTFLKRVTFPSGKRYLVGCGIYNMQMNDFFIEDLVNRAAALVASQGKAAFPQLRDKTGHYIFMDTYVFVDSPNGIELVNAAQPSLEGKNILQEKDLKGKPMVQDYINAAVKKDSAWVDYYWYKPGENTASRKHTYVRKVKSGGETYIIGAGYFPDSEVKVQTKKQVNSNKPVKAVIKKS